ncbi:hypothetical protein CsatB_027353 [Cannabis sativa]
MEIGECLNQLLTNSTRKVHSWTPLFKPYSFINISSGKEQMDDLQHTWKNMLEVAVVIRLVHNLYREWKGLRQQLNVTITSPYEAQLVEIKEKIGQNYNKYNGFSVKVIGVEELQGYKEEDILVLSMVTSNSDGSNHLFSDLDRVKLVFASARNSLWILGNETTLLRRDSVWKSILCDAKDRKCFFDAEEDKDLCQFIIEVKKELNQLDELFDADSFLFKNAKWKVLFSDNFKKSFEKIKSSQMRKLVVNMLLRLANGWRPKRRNTTNITCDKSKQNLKQFKVKSMYIICSIDIVKEHRYIQVLKVWDLLPLVEVQELVNRLDTIFLTYTDDFIRRCKVKHVEGDLEIPMSWETSCGIVRDKKSIPGEAEVEVSQVSVGLLQMKFYALSSGMVDQLLSSCDGTELVLPFELTSQEMEIINFDKTSFVLGRSGTGKSTVIVRKLVQREQLHHIALEGFHESNVCSLREHGIIDDEKVSNADENFLRQIFVTLNPRLCYAVKQQVSRLKRYAYYGGNSIEDSSFVPLEYIDFIPDSFLDLPRKEYPLVITLHKFLMMLDGTIGNSFFNRFPETRGQYFRNKRSRRKSMALESFIRLNEVNFNKFIISYWPHFNMDLTNGFEPSQVFIEIMSHLKGGLKSGNLSDGNLSQKDYILKSNSRVSNFSNDERKKIYDIFLQYEKLKTVNGEYDVADLVCDLHYRFNGETYEGDKLDFVYIDEVQDLTMGQIALFKYICKNVDDGYVFCGDTAQTIAKGVDFRFEDIRCLFYREFLYGKGEKGLITDIFQLSQNFRSHAGVLNLAQSVTNLLYHFFPLSIDVMRPETSLINGETPLLVEVHGENEFASMFNDGEGGKLVGFGAEQAILVRDDNTKNEVLKYVGKHALVLTISECKGLEFQDVLLYNFLSSSPIKNQWRVIYEFMKEHNIISHEVPTSLHSVNEAKHSLLCSELKQIYVAVTRTRQRLWIFENELSHPMCDYWKEQNIVKVRGLDHCLMKEIQVASSFEEWRSRGMKFFHGQNYGSARMCFGRAGDELWEKRAEAAELRTVALCMSGSNSKLVDTYLRRAAEIFESISLYEQAAQSYYDAKEYIKAGEIYLRKCVKYEEAGESFFRAGWYKHAASAYAKGNLLSNCLDACIEGKLFEIGLSYFISWKENATVNNYAIEETSQEFLEHAACYYIKLNDRTSMMKFVNAFHSKDLIRSFLRNEHFLEELFQLEIDWGCSMNASNIAKQLGMTLFGAEQLEKAKHYEEASLLLLFHVHEKSLWGPMSSGWPLKNFREKDKLLEKAKQLAKKVSHNFFELVCIEENILSDQKVSLSMLKKLFKDSFRLSSFRGQIFCARKILDVHVTCDCWSYIGQENYVTYPTENAEKILSLDQVSVGSLFYFWNVWKQNIERILEYLEIGCKNDNIYGKFCLDYFGVTISDENIFHLVIPDASAYLVKLGKNLNESEKTLSLKADQFVHAAKCYWNSQMVDVGTMVLEKLRDVSRTLERKSFYPHCQLMPFFYMFKLAKFLLKYPYQEFCDHLDFSRKNIVLTICSMDWKNLSTLEMIRLRGTEDVKNLLEDVIFRSTSMNMNTELTYKQVGNVAMMVTSCHGKLHDETYRQISLSFVNYPFWKSWIESFQKIGFESSQVSLVQKFYKALEQTYYADSFGESHYVSPSCFMYIVERLLILIFQFKGCFFSIKSSLLECLINQEWNMNASHISEDDWQNKFGGTLDTIAAIVAELLYNKGDLMRWFKGSNDLNEACNRELVLRLFVALCLLCVNCGKYYESLFELLDMSDITSLLPYQFYVIRNLKPGNFDGNICVLAQAFQRIGNPLVVVSSGTHFIESKLPASTIFVDLELHKGRDDLIRIMFK